MNITINNPFDQEPITFTVGDVLSTIVVAACVWVMMIILLLF